jgi:PKD repeat protein
MTHTLLLFLVIAFGLLAQPQPAQASSIKAPLNGGTVPTCDEASLLAALAGGGTVNFGCSGIITVSATLVITAPTTIDGVGQSVTLSGGGVGRIITTTADVDTLTLRNITLTRGLVNSGTFPDNSGGALFVRGNLGLVNAMILSNTATGAGGGAYVTGTLTLSNAQFLSNTAGGSGGGVHVFDAAQISGGLFQSNRSTGGDGGGLDADDTLAMTGTQFFSNTAGNSGGGVYVFDVARVSGGLFYNNLSMGGDGGGLDVENTLAMTGTHFLSNTASLYGGGLYVANTLTRTGTQFLSNTAGASGGGVYVFDAAQVSGGLFQNNRSRARDGGGLYAENALAMTGTHFLNNTAGSNGGGVFVFDEAQVSGGLFQNNVSISNTGGGLDVGILAMTGTQFLSNTSGSNGGGVFVFDTARMNGGLFRNNRSITRDGGGLYAENALAISGTQFLGNTARNGGAAYHQSDSARIVNSLFAGNVATRTLGAGLYLNSTGAVQIVHVTLASSTPTTGSAIYVAAGAVGITNTIIASHTIGISRMSGSVSENYNLFSGNAVNTQGTVTSVGNSITGNPAFSNPAAQNYRLSASSAALNAGTNASITLDFEGEARPQNGGFDIGFDEFIEIPISGLSAANSSPTVAGNTTSFTAAISAGTNVTYTWDFGDGSATRSGAMVTHTYTATGTYTAWVTATNSLSSVLATAPVTITAPITGLVISSNVVTPTLGAVITFTATTNGGSSPIAYAWSVSGPVAGGGTGNPFNFSFSKSGAYTVAVTATNSVNTLTTSVVVVVPYKVYLPLVMK